MNRRAPVPHLPPAGETPGHGSTVEGLPNVQTLREVIDWLAGPLLERDDHARMLLLALLSGEHVLLVGPPGTAKSALARRVHELVGGRWFERLVTRFTVPEELFGPLSLSALDEGRYERQTDAYLPTADVAFLDEVFKANSAILNALLGILNERVFDQGAQRVAVPLACLVAATNELPDDDGSCSAAMFHLLPMRRSVRCSPCLMCTTSRQPGGSVERSRR
jgi:MoxR-like ATPase